MIRPRAFALAGAYLLRGAVDAASASIYSTSVDCCQALTVLSHEISDWIRVQCSKLPRRDQSLPRSA
jgi:hypothetical protein